LYPPAPPLPASPRRAHRARTALALAAAFAAATALAACSSSSSAPSPAAQTSAAIAQDCNAVSGVLADGPDPDADSVGYAEAQVLPLAKLTLADAAVRSAVTQLDAAYKAFSATSGGAQTQAAIKVSSAESTLNTLCPGVAP
jgi:hypothetical protein